MSYNDNSNSNNKFDIGKFNDSFEEQKNTKIQINNKIDEHKLQMMGTQLEEKTIMQSTVSDLLIGIKNTWFYLIDDLLQQRFNVNTFTKENRLFFIGLTIVIIAMILHLYDYLSSDENNDNYDNYDNYDNHNYNNHNYNNHNNGNNHNNENNKSAAEVNAK